jgi:hypothetical protein
MYLQSDASAARAAELYPEADFPSTFERAKTAFGDTIFTCQYVLFCRFVFRS